MNVLFDRFSNWAYTTKGCDSAIPCLTSSEHTKEADLFVQTG